MSAAASSSPPPLRRLGARQESLLLTRTRSVVIRQHHEATAGGNGDRLRKKFKSWCTPLLTCISNTNHAKKKKDDDDDDRNDEEIPEACRQYRLTVVPKSRCESLCRFLTCRHRPASSREGTSLLAYYLHWMFRVNFFTLFVLSCIIFFALTILFAVLIIAAGRVDPQCIRVGGAEFDSAGAAFADAFALSWTTFSTVGYGSTYPALGYQNENPTNCLFITTICSLESFIGILYSGFCGAILFGKVLRIQSHAQVMFSDPIVIRYGSGVEATSSSNEEEGDEEKDIEGNTNITSTTAKRIPCPVLEFRIVNRLFWEEGGEIMDATLNVVASIDANDVDDQQSRVGTLSSQGTFSSADDDTVESHSRSLTEHYFSHVFRHHSFSVPSTPMAMEERTSRLVNRRMFSKCRIEANDHPFFKRCWLVRHALDGDSPLLKPRVRAAIRKHHGTWPTHLNSAQAVKDALKFNQILVSLTGVSNASASDVYAQKIYDHVDVNVGYQFVNLLYYEQRGDDSTATELKVDTDLINDVTEQTGPDRGEPLNFVAQEEASEQGDEEQGETAERKQSLY